MTMYYNMMPDAIRIGEDIIFIYDNIFYSKLVMFQPSLAQKPQLWPGFRRLGLAMNLGQAKTASDDWLLLSSGPSHGLSTVNVKFGRGGMMGWIGKGSLVHRYLVKLNTSIHFLLLLQQLHPPTEGIIVSMNDMVARLVRDMVKCTSKIIGDSEMTGTFEEQLARERQMQSEVQFSI
ncbi:hypothetical protein EDB19DRAFT_1834750 [Suillus lakei]|nr:hypothetical protein EDB19DRAFT_1834750 [Suillus lakei]